MRMRAQARPELLSAKTMIEIAQSENATLAWILRGVGCILIFVAFSLMMQPLVVAPEVCPSVPGRGRVLCNGGRSMRTDVCMCVCVYVCICVCVFVCVSVSLCA